MAILWWLTVGLVAGFLARLLVQGRDRMGVLLTLVLALAGGFWGGLVANFMTAEDLDVEPEGMMGAILGAMVLVQVYRWWVARRERHATLQRQDA